MLIAPHFTYPGGMEARVELVCSGDRTQTSCTHEWTCVRAANALTNWASQTDEYLLLLFLLIFFRHWYFIPKGIRNCEGGKNHELGVSRLTTSHFHIDIAEWVSEAASITSLNRNRKTLKKKKCLSWVISDWRNEMAQSRDEGRTDLINRTE